MNAWYRISNLWPSALRRASEGIKMGLPTLANPGTGPGVALAFSSTCSLRWLKTPWWKGYHIGIWTWVLLSYHSMNTFQWSCFVLLNHINTHHCICVRVRLIDLSLVIKICDMLCNCLLFMLMYWGPWPLPTSERQSSYQSARWLCPHFLLPHEPSFLPIVPPVAALPLASSPSLGPLHCLGCHILPRGQGWHHLGSHSYPPRQKDGDARREPKGHLCVMAPCAPWPQAHPRVPCMSASSMVSQGTPFSSLDFDILVLDAPDSHVVVMALAGSHIFSRTWDPHHHRRGSSRWFLFPIRF